MSEDSRGAERREGEGASEGSKEKARRRGAMRERWSHLVIFLFRNH